MTNVLKSDLKKILLDCGIQPSFQRLAIFEYLYQHDVHPTVDMIYRSLSRDIPTLSKTTVYNTLNLFIKKGIVTGLTIEENEMRYDYNVKPHLHLKCTKCKKIWDIKCDASFSNLNLIEGHRILEKQVYLKGICRSCLKKQKK
ncbi:MAG: transcriptional repressor [Spirochaetes bacterium]|nr:transcriptional repressor [Spirochaetota bacterium]